jgi:hypothetical protein
MHQIIALVENQLLDFLTGAVVTNSEKWEL